MYRAGRTSLEGPRTKAYMRPESARSTVADAQRPFDGGRDGAGRTNMENKQLGEQFTTQYRM
jgi:hypothetical protein